MEEESHAVQISNLDICFVLMVLDYNILCFNHHLVQMVSTMFPIFVIRNGTIFHFYYFDIRPVRDIHNTQPFRTKGMWAVTGYPKCGPGICLIEPENEFYLNSYKDH